VWSFPGGRPLFSLPAAPALARLAPDGRTLAWADAARLRIAALPLDVVSSPPSALLRAAERAAGPALIGR
jgi:hypothetical protein